MLNNVKLSQNTHSKKTDRSHYKKRNFLKTIRYIKKCNKIYTYFKIIRNRNFYIKYKDR